MTITELSQSEKNVLTYLLNDMDELQIKRRPLQPHALSSLPDADKQLYSTMLVAILANQSISDAQARLLTMLLDAMAYDTSLDKLYQDTATMDKHALQSFCELCDQHKLAPCFFMDVLTLARIEKPLTEAQSKSLAEMVNLLKITAQNLEDVLQISNTVLSSETPQATNLVLDFDYNLLKPWHEFSFNILTVEKLITGLTGGNWIVNEKLSIDHDVTIKNANITFGKKSGFLELSGNNFVYENSFFTGSKIKLTGEKDSYGNYSDFSVSIKGSSFIDGVLSIFHAKTVEILNSHFDNTNNTAYESMVSFSKFGKDDYQTINVAIKDSTFSTKNTRSIDFMGFSDSIINIESCHFTNQEYSRLQGSGIYIEKRWGSNHFLFKNCEFNQLKSQKGAVCFQGTSDDMKIDFENCKFFDCDNGNHNKSEWNFDEHYGGAIYCEDLEYNYSDSYFKANNCHFESASVFINKYIRESVLSHCVFKNSVIACEENNYLTTKCSFENQDKENRIDFSF